MKDVVVRTKEELKAACEKEVPRIVVKGELAEKLQTALKIRRASKWAVGLLAASLAAIPLTGGLSVAVAGPIAALTGFEVAVILAVFFVGVALVMHVGKDYKKVSAKIGPDGLEVVLARVDLAPSGTG